MDNVIEVQKQIKDNATEVNDFLKDLDSWAAEMKIKDNQLREQKLKRNSSGGKENSSPSQIKEKDRLTLAKSPGPADNSPPETSPAPVTIPMKHKQTEQKVKDGTRKVKERGKVEVPSPPKKEKIKAYEYDKWDKFNVDEECSKIDQDNEESSSSDEEEEAMENARLKQQAVAERERGNTLFKQAKYELAIERYTAGIQIDPYCPLLPANRAMAFLKVKKFGAAEQDCCLSLSLDPTYIKALQRRVAARIGLNKYKEAEVDCDKILQLEPTNKLAKSDKQQIQTKLSEIESNKIKKAADEAVKEEVKEKIEKLNIKDNMKVMFKPVKEKPPTERLEPTSEVSPGLLLSSEDSERKVKVEKRAPWSSPDPRLVLNPVQKQPHQRSKKPLQQIKIHDTEPEHTGSSGHKTRGCRMTIMEVDGDEAGPGDIMEVGRDEAGPGDIMEVGKDEAGPGDLTPKEIPDSERFQELPVSPVKSVKSEGDKVTILPHTDSVMEVDQVGESQSSPEKDDTKMIKSDGFASRSHGFVRKVEKDINLELEKEQKSMVEKIEIESQSSLPPIPKTSAQFSKDWRNLQTVQLRSAYLCQLDRDMYSKVFKSQLESKMLSEIISTLNKADLQPKQIAEQLVGLSSLPRMSALAMFLSSSELDILSSLLQVASTSLNNTDIELIKKVMSLESKQSII